ncbi:ATP-binding cassette domain-containing protein [Lactobacillus sp. CC-MHH1034]|uniref:ABC transporter ATP-binding protein n=1 Tax=Agrilactobacillus fermenti TaxID=2586909 RepID=UPI001E3212B8|nr:ATP-binding cassette domain-containing protein [Agrilactobacillus fermenti]MCD2256390.1 ATP-binding cassette domain-containing protein [Agrilactobacillus fermenti]
MLTVQAMTTYIGHKQIIKQGSFEVAAGDIAGLIGPNGAGKTTIMKTILGLMVFTGQIQINHQTVLEQDHHALAKVGALIEHPAIYPFLTGWDNLRLYAQTAANIQTVVTQLAMTTFIRQKAKDYSLGMKQKLGIALALLNQPELVLLDEPMNGLDIEATILVRKIIKQYARDGTTFLISSHILGELQKIMTDVILVNEGRIVLNQPIHKLNQLRQQRCHFVTDDMPTTVKLLQAQKIPIKSVHDGLSIDRGYLFQVQDLLAAHNLHLLALSPYDVSFEQLIVHLLTQGNGAGR